MEFQVNDLLEDFEGDKAVVREINDEGIGVEWDCRPGHIAHFSRGTWEFSNLSERVRGLERGEEPFREYTHKGRKN